MTELTPNSQILKKQKQVFFSQSRYHIMLFQSSRVVRIAVYMFFEKGSLEMLPNIHIIKYLHSGLRCLVKF